MDHPAGRRPSAGALTVETVDLLERMLRETAAAHGRYEDEQLGGVYDTDWPAWYAAHLAGTLAREGFRLVPAEG